MKWLEKLGGKGAKEEQVEAQVEGKDRKGGSPSKQVAPQPPAPAQVGGKTTRYGFAGQLREASGLGPLLDPTRLAKWAVDKGIFSDPGNLRLGEVVTRAEAATMVSRAFDLPKIGAGDIKRVFKDLPASHWAGSFVYGAVSVGVISGFGDDTFKPQDGIEFAHSAGLAKKGAAPPGVPTAFDPRKEWGARSNLKGGKVSETRWHASLDRDAHTTRDPTAGKDKRVEATQSIVDELDASNSKRYKVNGNSTYCNVFAHDYAHLMGAFVPRMWWTSAAISEYEKTGQFPDPKYGKNTYEINANGLHDWFHEYGHLFGWSHLGGVDAETITKAQGVANDGRVVIVVGDTASSRSGHISAIIPEGGKDQKATRNDEGKVTAAWQSQAGAKPTTRGASKWYDSAKYKGGKGVWVHG